ncbi:peptidylprolyl isomerase [Halochromatium roseum]|uniref:peptidylprolyl isomerase n=1 Tax=Halochromatium roseum TaxID=391920 RepID=UPI001914A33B|nr:peptidylprolyl isomerase [Halochromatium roseum]MBK5939291.1 molecular chaperone SurA [Halochromatium roseum]
MAIKSNKDLRHHRAPALIMLLTACLASAWAGSSLAQAQIQPLDAIVAVVNDDVIVQSELDSQIELLIPELQARGATIPDPTTLQEQVLDQLVLERLQIQRAKNLGIEVDEATLNEALTNIAARNGMGLMELREALEANEVSFDAFREDTRNQIITSRLQQEEVVKEVRVSEQEVDRFVETERDSLITRSEVRLSHILLALPENPSSAQVEQARDEAQALARRIRQGEDFASLARAKSDGGRAQEGGDLGWFAIGEVPSLAAQPAQTLARGEVTDPIRSPSGFHLIRVSDIKGDTPKPITQTQARHILIRTSEVVSDQDAERRLEQLRMRIIGGDDFSTLARSHSDDTGSALNGGDLGWVSPGDTVPAFEREMDALSPGEISQPFESPFGWHILQVTERREQDTADELLRLRAKDALRLRKAEETKELWLQRLRDEAYVEIRLDEFED